MILDGPKGPELSLGKLSFSLFFRLEVHLWHPTAVRRRPGGDALVSLVAHTGASQKSPSSSLRVGGGAWHTSMECKAV